ncbi:MAG TPA: glycosyltransferase family 4 protein [Pirellulales bacterium]|nr:glycosyltransferase family 4 protein [Pirellulales bacterium]
MSTTEDAAKLSGDNVAAVISNDSVACDSALSSAADTLRGARVGFVSGRLHYRGNGEIWSDAGLGRLINALEAKASCFTAALCPAREKTALFDHRLTLAPDNVLALPEMPTIARGFGKFRGCRRIIREVEERSDVVIVQLPFEAPLALSRPTKPRLYHICADIWAVAKGSSRFAGWKRLPALGMGAVIDSLQAGLFRRPNVRVITNGESLQEHYGSPAGRAVVSATIRATEMGSVARSRPLGAPFRVLYVGFLRPEKGIDLLVKAFDRVLDVLPNAELEIVGARDGGSRGMMAEFEQSIADLGRKGTVRFLGQRPYGVDLFQCFADGDVLVVPSRMEGTPRVLIEARAFRCPVIATTVGGNPTSIRDGVDGLLIPPEDVGALTDAVLRIVQDRSLRELLIANGLERARRSTLEAYADAIAAEASLLLMKPGAN